MEEKEFLIKNDEFFIVSIQSKSVPLTRIREHLQTHTHPRRNLTISHRLGRSTFPFFCFLPKYVFQLSISLHRKFIETVLVAVWRNFRLIAGYSVQVTGGRCGKFRIPTRSRLRFTRKRFVKISSNFQEKRKSDCRVNLKSLSDRSENEVALFVSQRSKS